MTWPPGTSRAIRLIVRGTVGPSLPTSSARPSRVNAALVATSPGGRGSGSVMPERRSSRSISLRPSTFHTSAARAPMGSSATRSRSSSSRPATRYGSDGSASRLSPTASSAGRSAPASECTNSCPPVIPKRASATFASPPGSSSVHRPLRRSNSSSRRAPRRPTRTTARIPSPLIAQTSAAGPEVSMVDVPSRTSMRHATPSPVPAPKIVIPSWRPLGDHEPSVTAGALGARSWTWVPSGVTSRTRVRSPAAGSELAGEPVAVGGPGHFCTSHGSAVMLRRPSAAATPAR